MVQCVYRGKRLSTWCCASMWWLCNGIHCPRTSTDIHRSWCRPIAPIMLAVSPVVMGFLATTPCVRMARFQRIFQWFSSNTLFLLFALSIDHVWNKRVLGATSNKHNPAIHSPEMTPVLHRIHVTSRIYHYSS